MICTRQKEPRYDEQFSTMRKTEKRSSSNLYHLMNNSGSCVNLEHIEMEPWIPSPPQIPIHTSGSLSSESEFSMARFKGSQVVVEVSATKPKAQIGLTSLAQKSEIPSSHYEAKISNVSKDISKRESLKEGTHTEFFQSTVVHRSPSAATLLKQNSQNSVYQQLKAMTPVSEWRSLPGSRLNLEPESVSLATRDSCDRVLPHVESTGMKAEKEHRYSNTCLEHTEMESQPLSPMPQQRSQSLVSLPDKCLVSARVNSAPSSTYGMQLSEMESESPFPSLKGRPSTRILPNDGYAPVQAELAPSSLKGAQASCSADSQSKSASLSTEELSTSLRTQTAENGEGYSQVSLRLSELDPESLSPSPKKRSDDSRSLTDFEGRVDQGDTSVVASYPRNVVESQTPVYPEVSQDLRAVTFKSLPALQPPDTTFEKSKEQPIKPTTGQTSEVKSSPCIVEEKCLADGVRKTPSSLEDISEGACHKEILSTERTGTPVLVSSSDNSFKSSSNEDVPLHRYKTALVGSSSFQMMSQFSRRRSPDKESNSSLEDNDFSAESLKQASVGSSSQFQPPTSRLQDDSRSLTGFEGSVDQDDTSVVASYPRNVVEGQNPVYPEVSRDLRAVTFKSLPALQPPDTTFEKSKEQPIKPTTGQTSEVKSSPCIVASIIVGRSDGDLGNFTEEWEIESSLLREASTDELGTLKSSMVGARTSSSQPSTTEQIVMKPSVESTIYTPTPMSESDISVSYPDVRSPLNTSSWPRKREGIQQASVEESNDSSYKAGLNDPQDAIMDASAVEEPGLASLKESQFGASSSSHSFVDVDFRQQSKEADFNYSISTELYGVEKRDRTLTEVPSSMISSDLFPRTVSKVPPQRSRISKVGRKFKKLFKIGKSKNRHKELQKLEPEGDCSDFDGKTEEPPTLSHRGIGHPTSHSSVSTLRDNWPFLAVAVETTESSILHSKGIAPSGQDSISSDVASSSANLYASTIETERPAPVQSSRPKDNGILTTDDAATTQRVNEMISTIVKNARAALECKLKDEISEPPCSLSDAVTNQRINEMINTIVNNARAALKYKLKDAEMSLCEQSMKSSSESSLLATEPFLSPNAKDSLSIITEISQGNLECTLQDISRRPSSETSFSPFLVENRETAGQESSCSLLDTATTQRINEMINTIVNHARGALQYQLKENASFDQSIESNCESLLLATESSPSPTIKESASRTVESLPGDLECLLQLEEIPSWTDHPDIWKESEVKISPAAPENINVEEDTEKLQGAGSSIASRNSPSSEESHDDLTNISTVFRAQED